VGLVMSSQGTTMILLTILVTLLLFIYLLAALLRPEWF
jgi:K+-transporting ATPase KdpF subunit